MTPPEAIMGNGGQQPPPPDDSAGGATDPSGMLRQIIAQIGQVAQMVPEAQQECLGAAKLLTQAQMKVVSTQQEPSPSQPVLGA